MPRQEIRKLVHVYNQGLFGTDWNHFKFRIVQETPTGSRIIHESREYKAHSKEAEQEWERLRATLLGEGWGIVESTYRYREEMYTREIPDALPQQITRNEDVFAVIERLAHLRDIGAITEDEFQKKKDELMRRI